MSATMQGELTLRREPKRGCAHRLCVVACGLSLLVFVGFVVVGLFDHDIAGAAVVGVLAAATFIDVAVLASNWASVLVRLFVFSIWAILAIVLLGGTLSMLNSGKTDADLLLTYGTAFLAFPLGLIAGPITAQLSMPAGPLQTIVIWTLAIGAGCLQWFVIVPMLVRARAADRIS
jgi:hypothetical protein